MRIPTLYTTFLALFAGVNAANCCDGVQPWQPRFAYKKGDMVCFDHMLCTAEEWTWNQSPATDPDAWVCRPCIWSMHDLANCGGVPPWSPTTPYPKGSEVVYHGYLWVAVQWTESNSPGDASGSWENLGPCYT